MQIKRGVQYTFLFFLIFSQFQVLSQIKFKHLTLKDGLSQSTVNVIIKDKYGFMWFGTQDGLNRYDGYNFTVYKQNPADSNSITDNYITCIIPDKDGNFWIGTSNGLNKLKIDEEIFEKNFPNYPLSRNNKYISSLLIDNENNLWVGTWGRGIYKFNLSSGEIISYTKETSENSLSANEVRTIYQDSKNNIWVGTWNGISLYNKDKDNFERIIHNSEDKKSLSSNQVTSVCEDNSGIIWIGTYESGLNKYDPVKKIFRRYINEPGNEKSLSGNQVVSLLPADKGIWVGTFDGGLNFLNLSSETFTHFGYSKANPSSINDNSIISIYEDKLGSLWIGTFSGGINIFDPRRNQFVHYKSIPEKSNGLGDGVVRSICEDSDGVIWLGLRNGGFTKFIKDKNRFENIRNFMKVKSVYSILQDRNKNLWIGTDGDGIIKYNSKTGKYITYKHDANDPGSLSNNFVMCIYEDKSGNIWVGTTGGGLHLYNKNSDSFIRFTDTYDPDKKIGKNVWAVYEDKLGDIWIGTWGLGLTKLDLKYFKHTRYLNNKNDTTSISNNTVFCITEDIKGNLFAGTWGGGLNMYRRNTDDFVSFTDRDGLPNNVIYGIVNDHNNNLWLSTNFGLCRFNPYTKEVKNYTEADGLQSNEFNQGAYCLSRSGEIYFGGVNGFNRFFPDSIKENKNIPPVLITNFRIFDKPLKSNKSFFAVNEISLSHSENYFSLEFAALDYTNSSENKYEYKLEGFDRGWIYSGKRRFASYTNLDPGEYIFKVRGSNNDGIWNMKGATLKIIINPPFWQTWWFRILTLFILAELFYLLYRYRINRLLEIERIKNRLASDLHDDIATNLSSIAMFSQIINDENKKTGAGSSLTNELVEKITVISQDSVNSIREIIWAIDPKQETIFDLLIRARDAYIMHCRAKNIDFILDMPGNDHLPKQDLTPEQRKNIWLFIKEAVTNSIKHSCATEISIHALYKNRNLNLVIIDNGKGFDTTAEYTGKGMNTLKKRAENLGGEATIVSNKENGTIINLRFKI